MTEEEKIIRNFNLNVRLFVDALLLEKHEANDKYMQLLYNKFIYEPMARYFDSVMNAMGV